MSNLFIIALIMIHILPKIGTMLFGHTIIGVGQITQIAIAQILIHLVLQHLIPTAAFIRAIQMK